MGFLAECKEPRIIASEVGSVCEVAGMEKSLGNMPAFLFENMGKDTIWEPRTR